MSYVKLVMDKLNGNYVLRKGNNILVLDDFDGRISVQDMKALCEVVNHVYETGYKKGARDERALVLRDVRFYLRDSMKKAEEKITGRDKEKEKKDEVNTGRVRRRNSVSPAPDPSLAFPRRRRR